jgi:hypothetical protein
MLFLAHFSECRRRIAKEDLAEKMDVKRRLRLLLAGTVLGTSILISVPAFADDAQLQQQINAMQRQLQVMQDQLAETKRQAKAAAQQAQQTQQAQQQQAQNIPANIPPNLYAADVPVPTKGPPSWFDSIHVSLAGSFIAMEGAWRQRNENASGASDPPFSTIPLLNSPLYNENETRFSAQQSRIAFKASGDIDPTRHVKGYYEMDFLGAAPTANSRESNSYTPRIRQAYFAYDDDNWHGHFSAGQMWSLATQNRVGILNSTENVPLTIDAQYVVGFNWARQPAIRFVEDWGKIGWFAVAVESSATNFASNGNGVAGAVGVQSANSGTVVPPGLVANVTNNCNASGLLDSVTNCSINPAPDIIEKFALDPGWGHYEALGIQRWFADATAPATGVGAAAVGLPGASWNQRVTFGWGVGGNALLPVWPKFVDLQGSVWPGHRPLCIEPIGRRRRRADRQSAAAHLNPVYGWRCGSSFRRQRYLRLLRPGADQRQSLDVRRDPGWLGQWRVPGELRTGDDGSGQRTG